MSKAQLISAVLAVGLLVGMGQFDRDFRARKQHSVRLQQVLKQAETVPVGTIGFWDCVALDDDTKLRASGGAIRKFRCTHSQSSRVVEFLLLAGLPKPIVEDLPDAVYPMHDYTLIRSSPTRIQASKFLGEKASGELTRMDFVSGKTGLTERVWMGWFDGEHWICPANPRFSLFQIEAGFRMQLSSVLTPDPYAAESNVMIDSCEEFLHDVLPILSAHLSATQKSAPQPDA